MDFFEYIKQYGDEATFEKGAHIFRQGDENKFLYFVKEGDLKAYYNNVDGKETIKSFIMPNDIIGSLTSAYLHEKCSFSLQCLSGCKLNKISFNELVLASKSDHQIANKMIEFLTIFAMKKEKREYELLCLSAEERYRLLANDQPDLLEMVTQNDIAKYLGITPVGLSRIKNRQQ
uniref:Cyclic nucleotide-binding domain-containing protein n=1 Tax=OCS116 cluster bacterium TaxID=2030921 RepID=A0A2A4Z7B9_9PROT